ncbi:MAG: hypothetical protein A3F31_04105 [Candidatus Levybacteria bacterium RIFCSPHIGHO2_12_FULL_38_12]|nr:MAG: hypothetical protein A3F31_04105 [Candidatus Levybacteria bacterium RIFCSPHIGHO2_12_FULL_38_12]OGH34381.1 MAG: hypothetical protein A3A47_04500 [Candidatus Levybacteria bacterium RIFCSPLOWO2_01_FULL_37_20]OGH44434.1 MAG: hypothetical protein A3J14_03210 [Candidatus Levybacteria bacterium RIFCSPLOWO2_02_FULL_37_18]
MKNIYKTQQKINFIIFCLVVLGLRLPPFYLLPVRNALVTSHSLARFLLILLFVFTGWLLYEKKLFFKIDRKLAMMLSFFFFTQSISILSAVNISSFILIYKDVIAGILIFILSMIILDSSEKINMVIRVLLVTIIIGILYNIIVYFFPEFFLSFSKYILYDKYLEMMEINIKRHRFFSDVYDAGLIPLLFYYFYSYKRNLVRIFFFLAIGLISFNSFLSNFRGQLLIVFLAFISCHVLFLRKVKASLFQLVFIIFFLYVGYIASNSFLGSNLVDRFMLSTKEDVHSIKSRLWWSEISFEMVLSSPILGVGLGNFYDNLSFSDRPKKLYNDWRQKLSEISAMHPHNILSGTLAETGFLGLLSQLILIGYFLKSDIKFIKKKLTMNLSIIICFWLIFLFSFINPQYTFSYLGLFWLLRGLVYKTM